MPASRVAVALALAAALAGGCGKLAPATEPPFTRCLHAGVDRAWVFEPLAEGEPASPPVPLDLALAAARQEAGRVHGIRDVCLGWFDERPRRPGPRPEPGRLAYRVALRRGAAQVVVIVDALDARILARGT